VGAVRSTDGDRYPRGVNPAREVGLATPNDGISVTPARMALRDARQRGTRHILATHAIATRNDLS
jgi:hypothetical protein